MTFLDEIPESNNTKCYINDLPLEIISKIVNHLKGTDIISLASVSNIWRTKLLNQNEIWKNFCKQLSVKEEDYANCLNDSSRYTSDCKAYIHITSVNLFGSYCKWWEIYNRYNMVLKNIKNNNFPTVRLLRKPEFDQSCYTDDYIINVSRFNKPKIEALNINRYRDTLFDPTYVPQQLETVELFLRLCSKRSYTLNMVCNKKFLIFEVHSVLFVYTITNAQITFKYSKIIQSSQDVPEDVNFPSAEYIKRNVGIQIDLCDDKLVLVKPKEILIFLIDLNLGKIEKEISFFTKPCVVNCIKYDDGRLMIGVETKETSRFGSVILEYFAVVYHFEEDLPDSFLKLPMYGEISQFKVTKHCIGVENSASSTPFIIDDDISDVFWLECDSFSFDCTRKSIYACVNQSIYLYDFSHSRSAPTIRPQKIALNLISNEFPFTPINDRFLLVRSLADPTTLDLFDVKDHVPVKSIKIKLGLSLVHVGKLSIVFKDSEEYLIIPFH